MLNDWFDRLFSGSPYDIAQTFVPPGLNLGGHSASTAKETAPPVTGGLT